MKKLRSKIILILTLTVILPIIPLSVLVYNLVNQSYRIGVNFQVEKAIKNGVDLSRELYNYQRKDLAKKLEAIETTPNLSASKGILAEKIKSSVDTMFWQIYSLQYFSPGREKVWDFGFTDRQFEPIDKLYFSQFQLPDQKDLIVSQRDKNLYTAIRKIEKEKKTKITKETKKEKEKVDKSKKTEEKKEEPKEEKKEKKSIKPKKKTTTKKPKTKTTKKATKAKTTKKKTSKK